jgi:hypothetical protein
LKYFRILRGARLSSIRTIVIYLSALAPPPKISLLPQRQAATGAN